MWDSKTGEIYRIKGNKQKKGGGGEEQGFYFRPGRGAVSDKPPTEFSCSNFCLYTFLFSFLHFYMGLMLQRI